MFEKIKSIISLRDEFYIKYYKSPLTNKFPYYSDEFANLISLLIQTKQKIFQNSEMDNLCSKICNILKIENKLSNRICTTSYENYNFISFMSTEKYTVSILSEYDMETRQIQKIISIHVDVI